jgi:hypothetical protein
MAVNMEPSMQYFQVNNIPLSAAYGLQKKKRGCFIRETMGGTKII